MFSHIKLPEMKLLAVQMAEGFTDEEGTVYPPKCKEDILEDLELIDNMLSAMRSKSLLNKKRGIKKMLDGLLSIAVGDEDLVPGTANNHLMEG